MTTNQQDANATQSDVTADETVDQPKSAREIAMEAIAEKRTQQRNEDMGIAPEPAEPAVAEEPAVSEADEQIAAQLTIEDPKDKFVRVKIDGQEQDVSLEEVLRNYQKGSAADRRLEEATRLMKEARVQAEAQTRIEPQQEHAVTQTESGPDELKVAVRTALSKVFEGDEEAAAEALAKVLERREQPARAPEAQQIDINSLAEQLQQRMDVKTAIERVRTDYPDIIADPDLDQLTYLKTQAKEEAGIPRAQALLEAASEVYQKMGKKPGRQDAPNESATREQKLARKAAIDTMPMAHAAAAGTPREDSSRSSVIAEMAAKRLGQTMGIR